MIVNAANPTLLGGGGVDGAIHQAAGPRLREACEPLGGCPTGEARITPGFDLTARHVIHTVGPVWQGGDRDEPRLLASCYRAALGLAEEHGCRSVAFPSISTGAYGYPAGPAAMLAITTVRHWLDEHDHLELVRFVCFSQGVFDLYATRLDQTHA